MESHDQRNRVRPARSRPRAVVVLGLVLLGSGLAAPSAHAKRTTGALLVRISGFEHDRGQVVVKLFRRGDEVPRGKAHLRQSSAIHERRASSIFRDLPFGEYALFVFHDENSNGTVDHNLLGFPAEPLGFSGGFRLSLLSGMPDFDDLRFEFSAKNGAQAIVVE